MQLKFKERYSYADGKICTQTNFRVRYRGFWARRHICNCHYIAVSIAKTFTLPIKLFNKRLACLNDHCLKMVSCGGWKGTVSKYTEKNCYFQPQNTTSEAKEIVRSILDKILNDSINDSTDIAFDFVNEIVNSKF